MPSPQQSSTTPKEDKNEWRTPTWLYRWVDALWHPEIDLAATRDNAKCERYLSLKEGEDALARPWTGAFVLGARVGWVNPPYSNPKPFLEKAIESAAAGTFSTVLLMPGPRGDRRDALLSHATEITFIVGRISFVAADGSGPAVGNMAGSYVVYCRAHDLGSPRVRWIERDSIKARWS